MDIIKKAKEFATKAHEGQVRKVRSNPFIEHPEGVAKILQDAGMAAEVVAAGWLHDVVEDTPYTIEDIDNEFGEKVATIVASNTEKKLEDDGNKRAWDDRKKDTINAIPEKTMEELALLIADKLDNLQSLFHDALVIEKQGEKIEDFFSKKMEDQVWYYTTIKEEVFANLDPKNEIPDFFIEYAALVEKFNKQYA
ncbi:HD domain-containing protein [Lottiidibacillus patelloidae]|uniref:HD domain-containing protein n=1 Tax=Lottiidibacillus patelloidae TaxID=2670334 RepID=UPI001E61132D|nr:HD domain-containing protein [Lottiidibacillus patelloidae]